jgi:GntR family transcriptional repressor for pyruvate dehydrogenase complex
LKANSKTLPELVSEEIKRYIIERRLGEGDRLPSEHEMAETLNVSRASIREALATLAAIGIGSASRARGLCTQL